MSRSALSVFVLLFFIAFVIAGLAPPILILFGVIDFAAAMWTLLAIRADGSAHIG